MSELPPRDHQLFAQLESVYRDTSFLLKTDQWVDFNKRVFVDRLPGDEESIDRLVKTGRVVDLGVLNRARHFVIKKKK